MGATRVSLTLQDDVLRRVREVSNGNISRFVNQVLDEKTEELRRRKLREDLIAGCLEKAEEDLEICNEWRYIDAETAAMADE